MFTGLVEEVGNIVNITQSAITIKSALSAFLNIGDSICVNGICLTVTELNNETFSADMSTETTRVSTISKKRIGDNVNLERAMLTSSRLDGHLVYGHIDTTARVIQIVQDNNFHYISIQIPEQFNKYVVSKGSIAIDGISLTIAEESNSIIKIAVIPATFIHTNLKTLKPGDNVNIEFDIISKYIEKNLVIYHNKAKVDLEFLKETGFLT